ncbi:MAG: B12-binding domain-containing radical SAM protein [Bacteroidota bacterium]
MKVSFITLRPKYNSYGLFSIAPLGVLYLGTILKQEGHEVTVYDEDRSYLYADKKGTINPEILSSDFVGISVISPTADKAIHLLQEIKKQNPNIRTAVGGPHVLGDKQAEKFSRYADVVVQKEAENIISGVVNGDFNGITEGSVLEDLDILPVPDFNLLHYTRNNFLDFFKLTPISTTRGCPRNCEFCTVSNIHGKVVRRRSADLVIRELRQRLYEGYKRIFFVDDNFSVQPSKRIPLLKAMISERKKGNWFESIIIQDEVPAILKGGEEYVQMLKRAGIKTVMLGVESFDDEKLRAMHKHHKETDSEQVIRFLRKHGIIIYAFGMAKPELDDKKSIRKQFDKLREVGVTYADMTIETPVPGTSYWEKCKSKLIATKNGEPDWDKWTFLSAVIPTKYMEPVEFQNEVKRNMKRFYSIPRALKQFFRGKVRKALTILYVWYISGKMYG